MVEIREIKETKEVSGLEKEAVVEEKAVFQTGIEIIHGELGHLARDIRNVVSATDEAYKELYLYSLLKVAEFCQNMPVTKDAAPYSLIERQMQQALSVLKVIRGSLFPKNSAQEDANKEEPKWIYAFFVYGLLYQLPVIDHVQFMRMAENDFISPRALSWLTKNETLFVSWRDALSKYPAENIFVQLTKKYLSKFESQSSEDSASSSSLEDKKVVEASASEMNKTNEANEKNKEDNVGNQQSTVVKPDTPIVHPRPPLTYAAQILFEYLVFHVDPDSIDYFRVNEGLFVSIKLLEKFVDTKDSRWNSVEEFINASRKILVNTDDSYRFKYSPTAFENYRVIEGIIIKEDKLSNTWRCEPANKDFKSETKL